MDIMDIMDMMVSALAYTTLTNEPELCRGSPNLLCIELAKQHDVPQAPVALSLKKIAM